MTIRQALEQAFKSTDTFNNGQSLDSFIKERFEFAPHPTNPGWRKPTASDIEHAVNYCEDHKD